MGAEEKDPGLPTFFHTFRYLIGEPSPNRIIYSLMRATVLHQRREIRLENLPDPRILAPTDAIIRVVVACICGSDLWPYRGYDPIPEGGRRPGHEAIGVVEEVGKEVQRIRKGDLVLMPFAYSDGTCEFCQKGLTTNCVQGGFFGSQTPGAQAEAVRIPLADGTLYRVPVREEDRELLPHLLTLTDVMATGHHAALKAQVGPGRITAVIGDGAVGLCGVLASRRLGAEAILLIGHHPERSGLARRFGADEIILGEDEEAVQQVLDRTGGLGAHSVLECVGTQNSIEMAIRIARPGGAIGIVGVPHFDGIPPGIPFFKNLTISGGPAPSRGYIRDLLPDLLEGRIEPGLVFDRVLGLDQVAEGYRAMDERKAIKVLLKP
jgi:threonine dehydrogenase-like Zn-dependent dehydrogenase